MFCLISPQANLCLISHLGKDLAFIALWNSITPDIVRLRSPISLLFLLLSFFLCILLCWCFSSRSLCWYYHLNISISLFSLYLSCLALPSVVWHSSATVFVIKLVNIMQPFCKDLNFELQVTQALVIGHFRAWFRSLNLGLLLPLRVT